MVLFTVLNFTSAVSARTIDSNKPAPLSTYELFFLPDSTTEDSLSYEIGDTISVYSSGLDTIYIIYAEALPDSLLEEAWAIPDPNKEMIITFSHNNAVVNDGVIGVALTDFFEPTKAAAITNSNYTETPNPWQALIDLAPKTIRVFSGASGKFMHSLGSYGPIEDICFRAGCLPLLK